MVVYNIAQYIMWFIMFMGAISFIYILIGAPFIWGVSVCVAFLVCMFILQKSKSFWKIFGGTISIIGAFIGSSAAIGTMLTTEQPSAANETMIATEPSRELTAMFLGELVLIPIIVGILTGVLPVLLIGFASTSKNRLSYLSAFILSLIIILFFVIFIPLFWNSALAGDLIPAVIGFLVLAIPLCFLPLFLMVLLIRRIKRLNSISS